VSESVVVNELMRSYGGLLVLLDQHRQIIAANDVWLRDTGAESIEACLGLRVGEAVGCVHAQSGPSGCGTSMACRSCGAVLAVLAVQRGELEAEKDCVLAWKRGDAVREVELTVRASPLEIEGSRFTLVALRDVSLERRRAALERSFFHDVNNLVSGLLGTAELLCASGVTSESSMLASDVRQLALRLAREVAMQRALSSGSAGAYRLDPERLCLAELQANVVRSVVRHPTARGRKIRVVPPTSGSDVRTDRCLLERVLTNLMLNALEASVEGQEVVFGVSFAEGSVEFWVRNAGVIPPDLMPRIFQRYFTTKAGSGRGQGLYAVKLFVEGFLQGGVRFESTPETGTQFTVRLPHDPAVLGWTTTLGWRTDSG
jgi:signal transduction histidine kinase